MPATGARFARKRRRGSATISIVLLSFLLLLLLVQPSSAHDADAPDNTAAAGVEAEPKAAVTFDDDGAGACGNHSIDRPTD